MFLYAHHDTVLIFGIHRVKTQKIENKKKNSIFSFITINMEMLKIIKF